jgi:ribulose-phosphate 3-epimerase
MKLIAPSILSADFAKLGQEIQAVAKAGADWIHVDVMDGHFVPNITMGPIVVEAAKRATQLPLDVHLMIENPDAYIPEFARAGADYLCVHVEAAIHLNRTIQLIKECGVKPAVAINPATSLQTLEWILDQLDFVLIMSVNPGFGGQSFIDNSLNRIKQLRHIIETRNLDIRIQVDGGVNEKTIGSISQAGADIFVAGSAIFGSQNYQMTIGSLRSQLEEAKSGIE